MLAAVVFGGTAVLWDSPAHAQRHGYRQWGSHSGYYGNHRSNAIWHGPSVHFDRSYHPTTRHWTPYRGWHTHGHFHYRLHYVPGHFDRRHNDHIHLNPRFHW
jgi:hypothetical protein